MDISGSVDTVFDCKWFKLRSQLSVSILDPSLRRSGFTASVFVRSFTDGSGGEDVQSSDSGPWIRAAIGYRG